MRFIWVGLVAVSGLFAGPKNPVVVAGDAKIQGLRIEAADRTIIQWSDFSIEADERVQFIQPNETAAVLNRVVDAIPSRLMGRLESNGRVVLVNPNGILVGKGGMIDTGSFIASSLDLLDRAFIERGELVGRGASRGMVVNEGTIYGKEVCLVGFEVQNGGIIEGERVGLAGALEVAIQMGPLRIRTKEGAGGLERVMREENPYRFAFTHPDDLDAASLNMPGPTLIERGFVGAGEVVCLGEFIDVRKEALIDANGGSVYIGGDFQGESEDWKNAKVVRIDGVVKADGERGGNVIAWSDGAMRFYGSISARGVEEGGFAEVSGKVYLDYKGLADLRAESGKMGTLLMDPPDISINTNADSPGVIVGPMYTIPALASVDVNNVVLGGQLDVSNVLISSNTAGGGTGHISVDAPVNWTMMPSTLTLSTTGTLGSITVNDVISSMTGGSVVLNSDRDVNVLTALGQIDLNGAGGSISLNAGRNITVEGQVSSLFVSSGKISCIAGGNVTVGAGINAIATDTAPGTAQILIRADANLDAVGDVQIGTATMTVGANVDTSDGSILVEGYNVNVGNILCLFESSLQGQGGLNRGDLIINARNDLNVIGGNGVNVQAVLVSTNGDMIVSVHNDATMIGGNGANSVALAQQGGGLMVFAIGNDFLIRGGTADNTDTGVDGVSVGLPNEVSVLVGRDLRLEEQMGSPTGTECPIAGLNNAMVRVGRNFFAQGGFDPTNLTIFLSVFPGTITSIFTGGNMVFQNEVIAPQFGFAIFNNDSTDLRAGGDIRIGAAIDKTGAGGYIRLESDASFVDLWTATPNAVLPTNGNLAILAGTPLASPLAIASNGLGAVIEDTGPLGAATWATASGDITILSRDRTSVGAAADFINGPLANQIQLSTVAGNVEINGFRNILIDPPIVTTGDVFIRSMNDLTIEQPISARNILLVCDEQGPNGAIGGVWSANGGSFTLLATGSLTATGTLQIFSARQGNNSISGALNLNGQTFAPGALFIDTDTEHWCTYFGGPGSSFAGPFYTVFYKDCVQQLSQQAGIVVSEFLVDLHSYDEFPGWMEEFFVESSAGFQNFFGREAYYLTRRSLKAFNLPKSYTILLHEGRI